MVLYRVSIASNSRGGEAYQTNFIKRQAELDEIRNTSGKLRANLGRVSYRTRGGGGDLPCRRCGGVSGSSNTLRQGGDGHSPSQPNSPCPCA